jgi:hypothetical protein
MQLQGMQLQGMQLQGMQLQGMQLQGMQLQGMQLQGMQLQGMQLQGMQLQGMQLQGMQLQGMQLQGMQLQGMQLQGMQLQGMQLQGMQLQGVDRLRSGAAVLQFRGLSLADVQVSPSSLQGLQSGGAISYVATPNPGALIRLQAGPGSSGAATAPGNFIYVGGMPQTVDALKGTFWNMVFADSCATGNLCTAPATCVDGGCIEPCTTDSQCAAGAKCVQGSCSDVEGRIAYYIADVRVDTHQNSSKYAGNEDIYLYTVYYRQPGTEQWSALCPLDIYGDPTAMAVPLDHNDWQSDASRAKFTFACNGSGVAAKCARNWGYKPWKSVNETVWNGSAFVPATIPMQPLYDACVLAARADYCQADQSYTKNGTTVDLFDTLDGFTSINPTVGLPYAPYSSGVMLHEEYQVSALDLSTLSATPGPFYVSENYTPDQLMSLPADEQALVSSLRRSGMESSRYADLDPGRSCPAGPFIDRCDPKEPYACYRAANMASQPYGSFIALNSPRFCGHDEITPGDPLDPLCNECINRICQIDPTCCGDPGGTYYPGSLVWDSRCSAIRQDVCKSGPDQPVWPTGVTAIPSSAHTYTYLSGAIGSFEGITTSGGTSYAEGWACDPDFPGASSPIQISVGGDLGATGASLLTATADQPLVPGWNETAAAACGGAGRHGFRVALPAGSAGSDVYVYGIDMNVPGAPFTLLRGGKKTIPGGASSPALQAAIWTGWIEPAATNDYAFAVGAGPSDLYRVWVNGVYVAGNWVDPDPSVPGAFTLPPPSSSPIQHLLAGTQYGLRVEYKRPDPTAAGYGSSQFSLLWSAGGAAPVAVPTSSLIAASQRDGNGLLASYFEYGLWGTPMPATKPVGAVDFVWTVDSPPTDGLSVNTSFAATFEGQVVPPASGDYTFTADTDGTVEIDVNGQVVTSQAAAPPIDPATCSHDICRTGSAVSRTCSQGYFCAAQICATDPSCCSITWDANCTQEVKDVCNLNCAPTPPISISLIGGTKYAIKVTYQHSQGGATLHLMWALPGVPRSVIPVERLFAEAPPSGAGVGINAAYFSDAAFETEYLDLVDASIDYNAVIPPGAALASTLVCGIGGAPPCSTSATALGAPGLLTPDSGASVVGPTVTVTGGGVTSGATVEIADGNLNGETFVPATTVATPAASSGGLFTASPSLPLGAHTLAARQSLSGKTSPWSNPIVLSVVGASDPQAPAAPVVTQPPGGFISGNGTVAVGGTAAPNATVTVAAGTTTQTFVADGTGAWSGLFVLPAPGDYNVTVTQTAAGHTSAATAPVDVKVALPALSLSSPADGASVSSPVSIIGSGAQASLGGVIVSDGDGRYFAERKTLTVNGDGSFADSLALDYGRHVLKVFQRANGLDGDGVTHAVLVPPPVASPGITSVSSGTDVLSVPTTTPVANTVTLTGQGTLVRTGSAGTGLRPAINVYMGTTKIGGGPMNDDGTFAVTVTIGGSGAQPISVTQVAYSLSGGGAAEGPPTTPITLTVTPAAPLITQPVPGAQVPTPPVTVGGFGVVGATVQIFADGSTTPAATTTVGPTGSFSTPVNVSVGNHRLAASQTKDGATSVLSTPISVAVGDVTPPTLVASQTEVTVTGTDPAGSTIPAGSYVTVSDGLPATLKCLPALDSVFPYGTTLVTCTAKDAAGNVGRTTFRVTVRSNTPPIMPPNQVLTFEAVGPAGAVADYRVAATGLVADCSPPGSGQSAPCTQWTPAGKGMGFNPTSIAMDPASGALYVQSFADDDPNDPHTAGSQYLKSTDRGTTWQLLPNPPGGPGEESFPYDMGFGPAGLMVPGRSGLHMTADTGTNWSLAFATTGVNRVVTDPGNPQHMVAYGGYFAGSLAFETVDGWISSHPLELPDEGVQELALDPTELGRMYAIGRGFAWNNTYYRKVAGGSWERLAVPPYFQSVGIGLAPPLAAAVAPAPEVCQPGQSACQPCAGNPAQLCQIHSTVFLAGVVSRDGGDTWQVTFPQFPTSYFAWASAIQFDRDDPQTVYAGSWNGNGSFISHDGGRTWAPMNINPSNAVSRLLQDPTDHNTLYALDTETLNSCTLLRSTDRGSTWTRVTDAGDALDASDVTDLAVDPVDPNIAYVISARGEIWKTIDGGATWHLSATGMPLFGGTRLLINPVARNTVYLSTYSGPYVSNDAGATWTPLNVGVQFLSPSVMAVDPLSGDLYVASMQQRSLFFGGQYGGIFVLPLGSTTIAWFDLDIADSPDTINPIGLWIQPDAQRTVTLAWTNALGSNAEGVRLTQFSAVAALAAGTFSAGSLGSVPTTPTTEIDFLGDYNITYDRSDGVDRFFTYGPMATGLSDEALYRSSTTNVGALGWTRVGGLADGSSFSSFSRLLIDPRSGGQSMTTISMYDTGYDHAGQLFDSRDGGQTWSADPNLPGYATWFWRSPADGALFATLTTGSVTTDPSRWGIEVVYASYGSQGTLWKRAIAKGTPPGARVVQGDVPITCTGGSGAAPVTPGSVFPIGDTVLTCTATDAFNNTTTRQITIRVRDTQPPALTTPTDPLVFAAPTQVNYTVTAMDAVDGARPVNCVPPPWSEFVDPITTVTCTASDTRGNTAQVSFPVAIGTTGQQVANALGAPMDVTAEATGSNGGVVTWSLPGDDSEGSNVPTCDHQSGSVFAIGTTVVTCSSTANGATGTISFKVVVTDKTPPVITVPAPIAIDAQATWGANVSYTVTATDAVDGSVTPLCTPASGGNFPPGLTTVACTATDAAGNVASASFPVTVNLPAGSTPGNPSGPDLTPPVLSLPGDMTVSAQDALGTTVTYSVTATDSGNAVPVDCVPPSGSLFALGDTPVSCMASDASNNIAQGSFVVHVVDSDAPNISGPADQTIEATGPNGAPVTFTVSASDYVSGVLSPVCTRTSAGGLPMPVASGATFPMGDSVVTCTATDAHGNIGTTSFTVTVRDTTPPLLTLPAAITQAAGASGSAAVTYAPTATDLVAGPLPVSCTPKSGSYFVVGTTPVLCTARDAAGNTATGGFTVTVTVSNTPPVVTVPAAMTVEATSGGGAVVTFTASANDAQDGSINPSCTPASGSTFPLGMTTVTCTATDSKSAKGFGSFTITVHDTTAPTLTLPANITQTAGAHNQATVTFTASASDAVSGTVQTTCTPASGSVFSVGTTTVSCTAQDAVPNVATGSFTVTILNTPPVVTVPSPITVEATSPAGAAVTFTATANDAQDGTLAANCTPASGSTFPLGTTSVGCSATDSKGVMTTALPFTVTVRDTTPPVVTVPSPISVTTTGTTAVVTFSATATDAVTTNPTVTCAPASNTAFAIGTTTVSCFATDAAGNKSATASFTVTVTAAAKSLVLTVPADVTISVCTNATIGTATATGGVSPVKITSNAPKTFALGTTTVTYTAKDASGKTVTGTQKVTAVLGDDASCCPPDTKVIKGTSGKDVIKGTSASECILGLGGDDVITGGGGNDYISGGAGNDTITAGTGNDVIYGGDGNDVITGGGGNDYISGGAGNDVINTGSGNDVIDGGDGSDTCNAGSGNNTVTTCEIKN